jgi:ribosomal protein L37AE/L43A
MITEELRLRKVCPKCSSLNVGKNRKHGAYRCKSCKAIFTTPAMKETKTNRNMIPESLRKIITKKQNEAAFAGDMD